VSGRIFLRTRPGSWLPGASTLMLLLCVRRRARPVCGCGPPAATSASASPQHHQVQKGPLQIPPSLALPPPLPAGARSSRILAGEREREINSTRINQTQHSTIAANCEQTVDREKRTAGRRLFSRLVAGILLPRLPFYPYGVRFIFLVLS